MTAVVTLAAVNLELQTTLPAGYTEAHITALSNAGEDAVKMLTSRTTFTGSAATLYTRAVLCYVCSRLVSAVPSISGSGVQSISENGASITFKGTSSSLNNYESEFYSLTSSLKLKHSTCVFASTTNDETFYSSATEDDE